jgi:hypothetical protein
MAVDREFTTWGEDHDRWIGMGCFSVGAEAATFRALAERIGATPLQVQLRYEWLQGRMAAEPAEPAEQAEQQLPAAGVATSFPFPCLFDSCCCRAPRS